MSSLYIGPRIGITAADTSGLNPGNLTTPFTSGVLAVTVPQFEIYHAVATNVNPGSSATIYQNTRVYSYTNPQGGSEWDPAQPMLVRPGDEIYFCWNIPANGTKPIVTIFLRFDPMLPCNKGQYV